MANTNSYKGTWQKIKKKEMDKKEKQKKNKKGWLNIKYGIKILKKILKIVVSFKKIVALLNVVTNLSANNKILQMIHYLMVWIIINDRKKIR